jgi:hypothetical protein
MTILAPSPDTTQHTGSMLTANDVLDIAEAIRNAVAYNATGLDARDRQALALFTYVPQLRGITRMLLAKLANGTAALPLPVALAMHLLDIHGDDNLLPEPSWDVQEAWLAARENAASEHRNRIASFGDDVIDALTAAGHPVRNKWGDGYRVHALTEDAAPAVPVHVIIEDVREGALYGMGGWRQMNAQRLAPYAAALIEAGFATTELREEEHPHAPLALVVARDDDAAQAALAFALKSMTQTVGGAA